MSAWASYYYHRHPLMGEVSSQFSIYKNMVGWAILSFKKELAFNRYTVFPMTWNTLYGENMRDNVRQFQAQHDLEIDGVIGPITAHLLFQKRVWEIEQDEHIPDRRLCRLADLESDFDPGAVGVIDPNDLGLVQEHSPFNPQVTLEQAADGEWALNYAAGKLVNAFHDLADWDAASVSYNVGLAGATAWLQAGKPSVGGPVDDPDLFQRAAGYLALLKSREC